MMMWPCFVGRNTLTLPPRSTLPSLIGGWRILSPAWALSAEMIPVTRTTRASAVVFNMAVSPQVMSSFLASGRGFPSSPLHTGIEPEARGASTGEIANRLLLSPRVRTQQVERSPTNEERERPLREEA